MTDVNSTSNPTNTNQDAQSLSGDDQSSETEENQKRQFNKFQLLDLVEDEVERISHDEHSSNDSDDVENSQRVLSQQKTKSQRSTGKKRNRKRSVNANTESDKSGDPKENRNDNCSAKSKSTKRRAKARKGASNRDNNFDDLDAIIEEQMRIINSDNKTPKDVQDSSQSDLEKRWMRRLDMLKIEYRNLNPDNELKRMFGRRTIENERSTKLSRKPGRAQSRNFSSLAGQDFDNTPSFRMGIFMTIDEEIARNNDNSASNAKSPLQPPPLSEDMPKGVQYFKFVHKKHYQETHFKFLDAAEQGDSGAIVHILTEEPGHVESLIQLSDIVRTTEDYKTASEFIQRALSIYQNAFHTSFNVTQARCRLDYRRPENRSLFIALFKHINYLGRRGLKRTPLEYTKLLISLEPENDPLAATLLIDYYALRAEEYDFLIEFHETWDQLKTLPNLRFSVALAMYMKASKRKNDSSSDVKSSKVAADEKLQETLLAFPNFLSPLFEACRIEPDVEFKRCSYFNYGPLERKSVPEAVHVLIRLYVARTNMIWKTKDVMSWLERNATDLAHRIGSGELKPEDPKKYWTSVFKTPAPRNLLRHLVLSPDLPSEIVCVPPSAASTPILDIDPFPPQNQILTYKRPPRRANDSLMRISRGSATHGALSLFFRSMIADYTAQSSSSSADVGAVDELDESAEYLARELSNTDNHNEADNGLQRSVHGLMDSIRNLLAAVQVRAEGDEDYDGDMYETDDAVD